jgi:hypothetical protein
MLSGAMLLHTTSMCSNVVHTCWLLYGHHVNRMLHISDSVFVISVLCLWLLFVFFSIKVILIVEWISIDCGVQNRMENPDGGFIIHRQLGEILDPWCQNLPTPTPKTPSSEGGVAKTCFFLHVWPNFANFRYFLRKKMLKSIDNHQIIDFYDVIRRYRCRRSPNSMTSSGFFGDVIWRHIDFWWRHLPFSIGFIDFWHKKWSIFNKF